MLFRAVQDSPWLMIFCVAGAVAILAAVFVLFFVQNEEDKGKVRIFRKMLLVLIVCGLGCWIGMASALHQQVVQKNDSFSKQLMDEYHATSGRSFSAIDHDSKPSNRATTVFTRDGKDTPVFIQVVRRDGDKVTMEFHVLDDNSLYPKTSE